MSQSRTQRTAAQAKGQKKTPPKHIRQRPILRKKVWDRLHRKDKNYMAAVCGDTGSGKSEFGLRFCEALDPNFSVDQVAFTVEDFMRLVNEDYPPGSFILFDEVGVALSHATHYDADQIKLNHVLETWREQNRGLLMTAPHLNLIQKSSRGLLHAQMDMQGINYEHWLSHARYRYFQVNTDTGDIYKKHPRLRDSASGRVREYKRLKLYRPSPDLVDEYLERKRAFNDQLNEEVLQQVTPEDEASSMSARDIAEAIIEEGRLSEVVSMHGGWNRPYVDADMIDLHWEVSNKQAKQVKKLLDQHYDEDDLEEVA